MENENCVSNIELELKLKEENINSLIEDLIKKDKTIAVLEDEIE